MNLQMHTIKKQQLAIGWRWTKSPVARQLFSVSRWLHVYLSATLLCLLLFFCITGFTLNHADWFSAEGNTVIETHTLPTDLINALSADDVIPVKALKNFIQHSLGLTDPRSIDMELDMGEVSLDYPLPAGYAFVSIFLDEGTMEVEYRTGSLVALFNDLHKGRYTGPGWSLLIDISAVVMSIFSIAGLVILLQHKKYRTPGLLFVAIGTLTPIIVYLLFVPAY